jgi:hypothetical protein
MRWIPSPGAQASCVLWTDQDGEFIYVWQVKWDKIKTVLNEVMGLIDTAQQTYDTECIFRVEIQLRQW